MATPKSTRIGIWIIAVVMLIGTIGSFVVMILANQNAQTDQERQNQLMAEYQKKVDEETSTLSTKYYPVFSKYKTAPAEFDKDAVGDEVTTLDIKEGDGAVLGNETKYQAYYIGWNPRGKSFDSSFDTVNKEKLKAPLDTSQLTLIPGWAEGVVGMKVGGVREITIPSDLAYGEQGSGEDIPANTPIKFIVMVIATK